MKTVCVSGGFDPLHVGHLSLFRVARALGDRLVVIVESDVWVAKKHRVLLPQLQRALIIEGLKDVAYVRMNSDESGDCSALLREERAKVFVVGLDHADDNFPEAATCRELGINVVVRPRDGTEDIHSTPLIAAAQWKNPVPLVAAVIRDPVKGVLISKRTDDGLWELPGGFVEVGEPLGVALVREVREELCVTTGTFHYLDSFVGKYRDGRDIVVAAFGCWIGGQTPMSTKEVDAVRWVREFPRDLQFSNEIDERILRSVL